MNNSFLYRLFQHSKTGFLIVVAFIICYAVFFSKKMDSVIFPYNSMFAVEFKTSASPEVYAVKINNVPVKITNNLYWKKDFLEESLNNYGRYKKNGDMLYMDNYLRAKIPDSSGRAFMAERLIPTKDAMERWLPWYIRFAGYQVEKGATIELISYHLDFSSNNVTIKDSLSIYKTIF